MCGGGSHLKRNKNEKKKKTRHSVTLGSGQLAEAKQLLLTTARRRYLLSISRSKTPLSLSLESLNFWASKSNYLDLSSYPMVLQQLHWPLTNWYKDFVVVLISLPLRLVCEDIVVLLKVSICCVFLAIWRNQGKLEGLVFFSVICMTLIAARFGESWAFWEQFGNWRAMAM